MKKIVNLLDNASNQPSRFRTRNWVEVNNDSRGVHILLQILNLKLQC